MKLASSTKTEKQDCDEINFSPGAWFLMRYGFQFQKLYISETAGNKYRLSKPDWLDSSGVWMTRSEMEGPSREAQYIGHGKKKWYWRWLPWRDLITPFHKPKLKFEQLKTQSHTEEGKLEELYKAIRNLRDVSGYHNTGTAFERLMALLPENN